MALRTDVTGREEKTAVPSRRQSPKRIFSFFFFNSLNVMILIGRRPETLCTHLPVVYQFILW